MHNFHEGQKLVCVNNFGREEDLTEGNSYRVVDIDHDGVWVIGDQGGLVAAIPERFEEKSRMTKEDYIKYHEEMCSRMVSVTKAKNADYTGNNRDPFSNFTQVESNGICSTEQGFLVRMTDKFARVNSFVQKGVLEVKDESIEDTLLDLANYAILLSGFIKAKKQEARK